LFRVIMTPFVAELFNKELFNKALFVKVLFIEERPIKVLLIMVCSKALL